MQIVVNGESVNVSSKDLTVVLESLGFECKKIVVALNQEFVAKDLWSDVKIQDGDSLDVLSPIEGG